jgi:hypothetical protein
MKLSLSLFLSVLGLAAAVSAQDGSFPNNFPAMSPSAQQTGGAGMGGGGVDSAPAASVGAPAVNNYGNINRNLSTFKAPAVKGKEKKEDEKGQPQMPQPPQGGGGGEQGGGKGGGGCKGACGKIAADGSELDQAAAKMLASGDPQLAKIGGDVQSLSNQVKSVNKDLNKASDEMQKALDQLKSASDELKTFADGNKKDADNIKTVAKDEETKGAKAKGCEPPTPPGKISGDPKRSATFPSGARGKISQAESAIKAAKSAIESAEATGAKVASRGPEINTALAAAQSRLDSKPIPGLSLVIERSKADVANGIKIHKERLAELEKALKEVDKAEKSGKEADTASKEAETKAKSAKTAIDSADGTITGVKSAYDAAPPEQKPIVCQQAEGPAQSANKAGKEPVAPAEKAVTAAQTAASDAGSAKSAVGAVGSI